MYAVIVECQTNKRSHGPTSSQQNSPKPGCIMVGGDEKTRLYSAIGFGGDISCQNFPPEIMIICGGFQSLKESNKAAGEKERKTRRFDHAKHQIPEQFHGAASEKDPNLLYKSDS